MNLLEAELRAGQREISNLGVEDVWLAFLRFGRRRFATPNTPDADGLLFQYGTYSFGELPEFALDLTRQFEIGHGDLAHYVQVHCEIRFGQDEELKALGSFDSWFFHHSGDDLEDWSQGLSRRQSWAIICSRKPTGTSVYQEQV
ncbi:hypothetical protein [Streptomyces sp. CA-111067]|uniref:hypothetical protein n=1 Tax=Streptomyces sp. CA-111067 TaxID=3240046 RepID=UPI003D9880BF